MLQKHFSGLFSEEKEDHLNAIVGQKRAKKDIKSALASGRHIILLGQPGIGKTTLAKSIAKLLPDQEVIDCQFHCNPESPICPDCLSKKEKGEKLVTKMISGEERFVRVQGSPDLSAEDLLGDIDPIKAMEFGPLSVTAFTPGKIFRANNGLLFFDEVNRCPAKLQNALLQVLEEGYATIGSYKVDFPANFIFIGTMNPNDSSTEQLSHVFLDRFDIVYMGHPASSEEESKIMVDRGNKFDVAVDEKIVHFIAHFIQRVRGNDKVQRAPSVRATLGLYERAQANAMIQGKQKVSYKHVFDAVMSVLPHRLELKPSVKYLQSASEFVQDQIMSFAKSQGVTDDLEESDVP
jgi:magnesium chelatase subunit I